jgi:hypothetical protein
MISWEEEKDRRNRQALTRLTKSLPSIFPPSVLARALGRPFIPPTPRLAIDSYWRAHPIRADRLARALATRSGAPNGWWEFWNAPSGEAPLLRRLQARRCGQTGRRLWKNAEVDHRIPLFRVWKEYRYTPWPKLLDFWGLPNLQVINRDAHAAKSALEARDRRATYSLETELT